MWTPATRRQHSRAGLRSETDLTDAEWAVIAPLMPEPALCGRPATWTTREILNAICYVLRGGIAWRLIPKDLPPKSTAFGYFSRWRDEGLFGRINHHLVMTDRERVGREASPTAVVLDSQSVKTTEFPFAQRTRMDETGMVGVAGMEIGSALVRASPSLSLIGGPSSTRYCRQGRSPAR